MMGNPGRSREVAYQKLRCLLNHLEQAKMPSDLVKSRLAALLSIF